MDKNIEELVVKEKVSEEKAKAESDFIPKDKRITHVEDQAINEEIEDAKEDKQNEQLKANEPESVEEKKEEPQQEDKLISNEKTGVKLEIAHDENEEHFDYSDDDYDEEEN